MLWISHCRKGSICSIIPLLATDGDFQSLSEPVRGDRLQNSAPPSGGQQCPPLCYGRVKSRPTPGSRPSVEGDLPMRWSKAARPRWPRSMCRRIKRAARCAGGSMIAISHRLRPLWLRGNIQNLNANGREYSIGRRANRAYCWLELAGQADDAVQLRRPDHDCPPAHHFHKIGWVDVQTIRGQFGSV